MKDKIEKLRNFLVVENNYKGVQTFNCTGFLPDGKSTIYYKDGIKVLYSYNYEYLEILGLSDSEFASLKDILDVEID